MATNFNDAPTDPDVTPQRAAPLGPTIPWNPNVGRAAGAQLGQTAPYSPTVPYPGPPAPPHGGGPSGPPTVANLQPAPPLPAPPQWPAGVGPNAPTIVNPPPTPAGPQAPAWGLAPRLSTPSTPARRVWKLLPLPHILLGVGFVLLLAGLNIPWGATTDGMLVYAQSFQIPFLTDQPGAAEQLAQTLVTAVGVFSLTLAGMNYVLTFVNWLSRPMGVAGCATALLMPLMLILMLLLLIVDGGALIFGAFDPLAGVALAPWQTGFTLNGAHAELGYYAWYTGVILNAAGMLTQPFVRR